MPLIAPTHRVGVTAGKFNPPHLGHLHLLEEAAAQCGQLVVLVCDRPDQTLDVADRVRWLAADAPDGVSFIVTPDDLPADDSRAWADRTREITRDSSLPTPTHVFTSEDYGDTWAAELGLPHVTVDPARTTVPVRATDLRADLAANFHLLAPAARAGLCDRVVLVGAESTGKTTLARQLAEELGSCWVPEWGRTYDAGKQTSGHYGWGDDEFLLIGRQQAALEDALARRSGPVLICDTDPLATCVWQHRYTGRVDPDLQALAGSRPPALYLLCTPDLPWEQDGTRESALHRTDMHADFARRLGASGVPYVEISGRGPVRIRAALDAIAAHGLGRFDPLI